MRIWQADFYRRPLQDPDGQPLWELLICDRSRSLEYCAFCPQSQANSAWLTQQLQELTQTDKPDAIWVFRPQSVSLIATAAQALGIRVEPQRRTATLKQWLLERTQDYPQLSGYTAEPYKPTDLDKPPPVPIPENLWGDVWRFATLSAGDIVNGFSSLPIPILEMPDFLHPINLRIPSNVAGPGIVIDSGRQSMQLAHWLQENHPVSLHYIPGSPDGLILESGLVDRW
ncbi:MAG: Tab2 family RNA-binding protein, partial [Cyanobacteriota bacterium]|nr:Tab2 family RNA-binding protein [Cyanobacteriota bacterium]